MNAKLPKAKNERGSIKLNNLHFPVSFGSILISWNSYGFLSRIEWSEAKLAHFQKVEIPSPFVELMDQIRAYFYAGEPLAQIPWDRLDQAGWSCFQKEVYHKIASIPHGETRTYGWVAGRLGNSMASRAVGQALRKNTLPILIPCHRVKSSTSLGGFMGTSDPSQPEIQLKRCLMMLEEEYQSPIFSFLPSGTSSLGRMRLRI